MLTRFRSRIATVVGSAALAIALPASLAGPAAAEQSTSEQRRIAASSIAAGTRHACVLTTTRDVRCWGSGSSGKLGYGNTLAIGNDETPDTAGEVPLGGKAVALAAGDAHTCALLTTGRVRCWGSGDVGQLGYGNTDDVGDDESPASVGDVPVGGKVRAITAGADHTCAVLLSGATRCWGESDFGRLGYGNLDDVGDDETPAAAGNVDVGGEVAAISAGREHTCALLSDGSVRCWGRGGQGRTGHGNADDIGDDEVPAGAGAVDIGAAAVAISAGGSHTCAVLTGARLRCWGSALQGKLGYGNPHNIGDDEAPAAAGDVDLAGEPIAVDTGNAHTCVVLATGFTRCFGAGLYGKLGYGDTDDIGDDETPAEIGNVPMLERAVAFALGGASTCAITDTRYVRCWGYGDVGRLGYGNEENIGDDEPAHAAGRLALGADVRTRAATTLTLASKPKRDRTAPYTYRLSGRVGGDFAVDGATCTGQVRIKVTKPGGAKVSAAKAKLKPDCRYRVRVKVAGPKVASGTRVRLKVHARFGGSPDLAPSTRDAVVHAR